MNNVHWASATSGIRTLGRDEATEALRPEVELEPDEAVVVIGGDDDIAVYGTKGELQAMLTQLQSQLERLDPATAPGGDYETPPSGAELDRIVALGYDRDTFRAADGTFDAVSADFLRRRIGGSLRRHRPLRVLVERCIADCGRAVNRAESHVVATVSTEVVAANGTRDVVHAREIATYHPECSPDFAAALDAERNSS